MDRIKKILGASTSKVSVNSDAYLNVAVTGKERLLPLDNINKILDITEQFNVERQSSPYYRILGKVTPLISNVLFNTTGSVDCWEAFSGTLFTNNTLDSDKADKTFGESIKTHLKEVDGWYGYFDPVISKASLCNFFDMEPKRSRFSLIPDLSNESVKNWELTITYPYTADTTHAMINGGIKIIDAVPVTVGGKPMVGVSVPVKHNVVFGSTIRLSGTNMDGDYEVKRIGLDNGNLKEYYFCIDAAGLVVDEDSKMNKLYNETESQYYFRKFKKIKTRSSSVIETDDYEVYKLAFSETIFSDEITQFVFNEDIDVNTLYDNLGRPLSELYFTIIKTDSNGIFTNISSGIEAPLVLELNNANSNDHLKQIPVIQKIHNVPTAVSETFTPLESDVSISSDEFYGDVVEYNVNTLEEVVLGKVYHRFNTVNRETTSNSVVTGPRPEGYYYSAHNRIQIRNFSSYIEEGTETTANKPPYTTDLGNGRYIWRDLLEIGRVDIKKDLVNYPFLNGCHYLFQNYILDVKRQDAFDNWNLYYSQFPADPIGNTMTNKFTINSSNNAC